jgi:nicotinamidase/pyrazinamidase
MEITSGDALVVVDVQNDFCPGGALPVPDGDAVIPVIQRIADRFNHIILTQDWHPRGHCSFVSSQTGTSSHSGGRPAQAGSSDRDKHLWPDHCVQGTRGADFHPALYLPRAELIVRKGFRKDLDSYSAFFENDRTTPTGLAGYCRERGFGRMFFAGLAYDFCVGFSALDARSSAFQSVVIPDACRSIDVDGSVQAMEAKFARHGVLLVDSGRL